VPPRTQSRDPGADLGAFLGRQLREIRIAAGYKSQDDFAPALSRDRSVLGKAESGEYPPTESVLTDWLDLCGISGRLRDVLTGVARIARLRNSTPLKTAPWFETEARAHTLRYWAPVIVPGIAQTEAYARELFVAMGLDDAVVAEFLEIRMGRQAILSQRDAPDMTIVLWEPVLHHQVGAPEIMREQMGRLIELSHLPTVTIHILPSSHGANAGLGGPINLAATDDAPELLGTDGLVEDHLTTEPAVVRKARATFNNVRADALPRADSRIALTEAMERWSNPI
jgi:Domain of unknown function (DUF5753)/Helix-turn-helix domain